MAENDNVDPAGFLPEGSEALSKFIEEDLKNGLDSDEDINESEETLENYSTKAFLKAAEKGKKDLVIKFLEKEGRFINCKDSDGYSALHRASYNGHVDVVKVLLVHGADIGSKTENDWQPLHCACRWGELRGSGKFALVRIEHPTEKVNMYLRKERTKE